MTLRRILTLFALSLLAWRAAAADSVLVVSIDGLHPLAVAEHTAPNLHALMAPGQYSLRGRSTEPPRGLIAHTAMFLGEPPRHSSKADMSWQPGEPQVALPTLFDDMRKAGYRTAFYYAKPKLGYLVNAAVGEHAYAVGDGIDRARAFFRDTGKRFVFLNLPGRPWEIYENRQFTRAYFDQLARTDAALAPLFDDLRRRGNYVVVVASAHAGPDDFREGDHPEDYRLPLIFFGNRFRNAVLPDGFWPITNLRELVGKLIE